MATKTKQRKVSLIEYADKHNKQLTRRGKRMSWSYIYRLIRQDIEGKSTRSLWFKYTLEGEKDRIWILLEQ
jgi:hypothetical protein